MTDEGSVAPTPLGRRVARLGIVLAGIILGQAALYGPSLIGQKVLLPLDILARPNVYLPATPATAQMEQQDRYASDLIYIAEPQRRFAVAELWAGRVPMWAPNGFAGAPFMWPRLSPFAFLECCTESPVILAWTELFVALVAGLGAYGFFRQVLRVGFWPAAICAWCYPLTGFFVLWQGYGVSWPVCWLPWMLWAVHRTILGCSGGWGPIGLSVVTGLVLTSHLDIAGQVLLVSGLFALWCLGALRFTVYDFRGARQGDPSKLPAGWSDISKGGGAVAPGGAATPPYRQFGKAVARLTVGWVLGFLLAAPYVLPVVEYTRTGARMARRSAGEEERPPVGLSALPQVVMPDMYGTRRAGSPRMVPGNQPESSASAYCGLLATLVVAPLAWRSRRHRAINAFWAFLALFALSWSLNIPGFVHLLRLPGLNMMSHNRLVFAAGFAILAMAAVGLEVLAGESSGQGQRCWDGDDDAERGHSCPPSVSEKTDARVNPDEARGCARAPFAGADKNVRAPFEGAKWLPAALLAILCLWCIYRTFYLPAAWVHDLDGTNWKGLWFTRYYATTAVWCALGVGLWALLLSGRAGKQRLVPAFGFVLIGNMLWFACGRSLQCDPALYYPPIPALEQVAHAAPGRIIGYNCLPANLAWLCGLRDIRGYDAVDPARLMDLVTSAADPRSTNPPYALTQWLTPKVEVTPEGGAQLPPIMDLLGVRYVVFRGSPSMKIRPAFQSLDYWVITNAAVLDRAFVPRRVEVVSEDKERLARMMSPEFNPREVAFVETPVTVSATCQGQARIVEETPARIVVVVEMATPGLVVLADLWDKGWRAWLNGEPRPILRADHALRGAVVPAGHSRLEFRYEPLSFTWGLRLAAAAAVVLAGMAWWKSRKLKSGNREIEKSETIRE